MRSKWIIRLRFVVISIVALNLIAKGSTISGLEKQNDHAVDTPDFSMTGYATVEAEEFITTKGGEGGMIDTVSSLDELLVYACSREKNTAPGILYIKGKIESTESIAVTIKHGANISIIGIGRDAELKNAGLKIWDYNNVIVRNLTIHEVLYPNDAITIDECHHVWIDHCELYSRIGEGIDVDTYDGLLDIKNGSRYVTVSWNYFHDHMKCSLIGHSDGSSHESVDSQFKITYHHNYFQNTDGRNPSLRFGAIHMFNNYLENIADYGIAVRQAGHAKLDNNHFESVNIPVITNKFDGPEGYACLSGNIYSGTCSADDNSITRTGCDFWDDLPYSYTPDSASQVAVLVKLFAGAGVLDTVKAADPDTNEIAVDSREVTMPLLLTGFSVSLPYPQPVRNVFNIDLYLPEPGLVEVMVVDMSGRYLDSFFSGFLQEGTNAIQFERGNLQAGLYYYVFRYHGYQILKKVVYTD